MNVKLITKALHTLSLLSEDDVTTVMNLRALSEEERELLITVLEPQKTATRKSSKKSSKGGSKPSRASGIAAAINRSLSQGRQVTKLDDPDDPDENCGFVHGDGNGHVCGLLPDHNIHHLQNYVDYHPFVSAAQPAHGKSSTNGGATNSTASIETEKEDVGVVVGGSGE